MGKNDSIICKQKVVDDNITVVGGPPPSPTRNFSKVFSRLALDVTLATTGYYERICRVSHPGHVTVFGQSRPPFPSSEFIHKFTVKVY